MMRGHAVIRPVFIIYMYTYIYLLSALQAATKIQAGFRGMKARQDVAKMKTERL